MFILRVQLLGKYGNNLLIHHFDRSIRAEKMHHLISPALKVQPAGFSSRDNRRIRMEASREFRIQEELDHQGFLRTCFV